MFGDFSHLPKHNSPKRETTQISRRYSSLNNRSVILHRVRPPFTPVVVSIRTVVISFSPAIKSCSRSYVHNPACPTADQCSFSAPSLYCFYGCNLFNFIILWGWLKLATVLTLPNFQTEPSHFQFSCVLEAHSPFWTIRHVPLPFVVTLQRYFVHLHHSIISTPLKHGHSGINSAALTRLCISAFLDSLTYLWTKHLVWSACCPSIQVLTFWRIKFVSCWPFIVDPSPFYGVTVHPSFVPFVSTPWCLLAPRLAKFTGTIY